LPLLSRVRHTVRLAVLGAGVAGLALAGLVVAASPATASLVRAPSVRTAASPQAIGTAPAYWEVASDGGAYAFGAPSFGGLRGKHLNEPIVGMAATADGGGYWLVASDGGVFTFGDAHFYGSTGGIHLNRPVVGMAATPDGGGYWLVASDGGIFTFGDARFDGSLGSAHLNRPIVGMATDPVGGGYWLVASDGGIFTFDAPFYGSTGASPAPAPVVAVAATSYGTVAPPGTIGYDVSQYQCTGSLIPARSFAVVQVSGGAIDSSSPNPCYTEEAAWAGSTMSGYIFLDGLPSPAPAESLNGPDGACAGVVTCESYNFGWYWAQHWIAYSRSVNVDPPDWWLDVEIPCNSTSGGVYWQCGTAADTASNDAVISGAVAAIRADGLTPGLYSTSLQWGDIAGALSFPGIALWVPGAYNLSAGPYNAVSYCGGGQAFAGGTVELVQYGYAPGYTGPASPYDQDYACVTNS
jgi:hypothetical protein